MKLSNGVLWRESGFRLELCKSKMRDIDGRRSPFLTLYTNSLNPSECIVQCLTRWEAVWIGIWFIFAAVKPNPHRTENPE